MNHPHAVPDRQDRREQKQPSLADTVLWQFDDEALELALKTVSCNPKDVAQFLRAARRR